MFDLDWIRQLMKLMDESDVDSLELSRLGTRIVLSKSPPVMARLSLTNNEPDAATARDPATSISPASEDGSEAPAAGGSTAESSDATAALAAAPTGAELTEVLSPMVGTFYRAPAPDAPPYVEVGDRVKVGQTLCILEAMKLMNELEAEVAGEVRQISVQNAEPVEYGQVLFRIALDGIG